MSMAVGIPIGFGAGIAVGIASGRQSARDHLHDYAQREQITILDGTGHEIPVEVFLDQALSHESGTNRKWVIVALLATGTILVLGVVALGLVLWLT